MENKGKTMENKGKTMDNKGKQGKTRENKEKQRKAKENKRKTKEKQRTTKSNKGKYQKKKKKTPQTLNPKGRTPPFRHLTCFVQFYILEGPKGVRAQRSEGWEPRGARAGSPEEWEPRRVGAARWEAEACLGARMAGEPTISRFFVFPLPLPFALFFSQKIFSCRGHGPPKVCVWVCLGSFCVVRGRDPRPQFLEKTLPKERKKTKIGAGVKKVRNFGRSVGGEVWWRVVRRREVRGERSSGAPMNKRKPTAPTSNKHPQTLHTHTHKQKTNKMLALTFFSPKVKKLT